MKATAETEFSFCPPNGADASLWSVPVYQIPFACLSSPIPNPSSFLASNPNYLRNIVTGRAVKVSILLWRAAVWFLDTFLIVI